MQLGKKTGFWKIPFTGAVPGNPEKELFRRKFLPIDDQPSIDLAAGFDGVFSEDDFESQGVVNGRFLMFAWRTDVRRASAAAVKRLLDAEIKKLRKRQPGPIFKAAKADMKEQIKLRLLGQAVPMTSLVFMAADLSGNVLYLTGNAKKASAAARELAASWNIDMALPENPADSVPASALDAVWRDPERFGVSSFTPLGVADDDGGATSGNDPEDMKFARLRGKTCAKATVMTDTVGFDIGRDARFLSVRGIPVDKRQPDDEALAAQMEIVEGTFAAMEKLLAEAGRVTADMTGDFAKDCREEIGRAVR
jgi:hypothetical protein